MPPNLDAVLDDLTPDVLTCPNSDDTPAGGGTTQAVLADLPRPGHLSYVYCGSGLTESALTADTILATEDPAHHEGEGMNVLLGDGTVEFYNGGGGAEGKKRVDQLWQSARTGAHLKLSHHRAP